MNDKPLIFGGLVILLGLLTFPIWYNTLKGTTSKAPDLVLPTGKKQCVMPREYMKDNHMTLLIEWRDQVVRQGKRNWVAHDGATYRMSLSGTCLGCHAAKADFCDRCHDYAAVKPYCWDCHVDPKSLPQGALHARR